MRGSRRRHLGVAVAAGAALVTMSVAAIAAIDIGVKQEGELASKSNQLFGVQGVIPQSSTAQVGLATANADPTTLATFASSLSAEVVTSGSAGESIDMMALWPDDEDPEWLIACNEEGAAQPGVQRIRISDGLVETILTGTINCDPAFRTQWGTIIFAEENGTAGRFYELIDPLNTTGVSLDASGNPTGGTGTANIVRRDQIGRLSFEGISIFPNGVTYYGDENRPNVGTTGGAYYKFIPTTLWNPDDPPITDLDDSPFVSGDVFGLRLGKRAGNTDYGQGTQTGLGTWVPINEAAFPVPSNLRAAAAALKLTGYYRPEDFTIDFAERDEGNVRFCANNTGNEGDDQDYGETICITDGSFAQAAVNGVDPEVQFLVIGYPDFAMMDNLAYQPGRGNWIVHEDGDGPDVGRNNDLWDCLPDGGDGDLLSDGCVRIGTLNDLNAEWTGGVFDASGERFFVSVQHNITGFGVVLVVTGW